VFFFCRGFFVDGWPPWEITAGFLLSLVMAFMLGFFLEATIGLIGFWFLEVSSLLFVYMLLNYFLSGHMFPLDMLPQPWGGLVELLPMKYLAYFPAAVFLGKISPAEMVRGLWIAAGWIGFFMVTSRWMYHRGVRRYSGYGG
jgi:ABC-2 type transport system permease protein